MGEAYVATLRALGVEPLVVGRSRERVESLGERLGVETRWGGLDAVEQDAPAVAIVAVGPKELPGVASALLERGCRRLLVEKPGALYREDLERLVGRAGEIGAEVFVGYNRRFYPSVDAARLAIEDDGGPLSAAFDFTEIEERVLAAQEGEEGSSELLARWGLVNSVHVIDLFSHLAGRPERWTAERAGSLSWHPAGSLFCGSGVTEQGALFSYLATWAGAGRWSVEVTTTERKLILRPLEELHVQRKGRFEIERVEVSSEPPGLKPGLHGQVGAFLACAAGAPPDPRLCSLDDALAAFDVTRTIFGYP
jgi:predicted dehydrogenase